MLRKFWVAGNLPLLTEPFHLSLSPGQVCFQVLHRQEYIFSLFWPVGELQKTGVKLGGRIADNQKQPSDIVFHLRLFWQALTGPHWQTGCSPVLPVTTSPYPVLCVNHRVTTPKLKCFPRTLAPPKLSAHFPACIM